MRIFCCCCPPKADEEDEGVKEPLVKGKGASAEPQDPCASSYVAPEPVAAVIGATHANGTAASTDTHDAEGVATMGGQNDVQQDGDSGAAVVVIDEVRPSSTEELNTAQSSNPADDSTTDEAHNAAADREIDFEVAVHDAAALSAAALAPATDTPSVTVPVPAPQTVPVLPSSKISAQDPGDQAVNGTAATHTVGDAAAGPPTTVFTKPESSNGVANKAPAAAVESTAPLASTTSVESNATTSSLPESNAQKAAKTKTADQKTAQQMISRMNSNKKQKKKRR